MNEGSSKQLKTAESKLTYQKPEVRLLSNLHQTDASKKMTGTENMIGMDGSGPS